MSLCKSCLFGVGFFSFWGVWGVSFAHVLVRIVQCQKSPNGVLVMENRVKRWLGIHRLKETRTGGI